MPQLNLKTREIVLKIVYYGPALSGKTTNLQQIHALLARGARGKMVSLDTQDDRTLYFDFLPVEFGVEGEYKVKLKTFTVPGQVMHRSTRRVVLSGADAVAFIADSQRSAASANAYSYRDLETNLRANGLDIKSIAQVVQFNKRDVPNALPTDKIVSAMQIDGLPTFDAIAIKGDGVLETLKAIIQDVMQSIQRELA